MWHRGWRQAGIAVVALAAIACDQTTRPEDGPGFDPDVALADYQVVDDVLASSGWRGFQALNGRMPFRGAAAAVVAVAPLHVPGEAGDARSYALELAGRVGLLGSLGSPSAAPIISDFHRGKTFVYDPGRDEYVVDPDRSGAPATGVRFIVYEAAANGRPDPDREIGHADLVDEGDGSDQDVVLHLIVVVGGSVVLDYRTSVDGGEGVGAVSVDGFLRGDGNRLDFDIDVAGSNREGRARIDVAFEMRVDARGFRVTGSVTGIEEGGEGQGDVELTVRHGPHSIDVDVTGTETRIDGSIHLNGRLFATVTGDPEAPELRGAGGNELTPGEAFVLRRVLDVVEDVFDFLEDLLDPVDELVLLGLIL